MPDGTATAAVTVVTPGGMVDPSAPFSFRDLIGASLSAELR